MTGWEDVGFNTSQVTGWEDMGFNTSQVTGWEDVGFNTSQVTGWEGRAFTPVKWLVGKIILEMTCSVSCRTFNPSLTNYADMWC